MKSGSKQKGDNSHNTDFSSCIEMFPGERLRIFAIAKFGTLAEMARELGMKPQQLSTYTRGASPNLEVLGKFVRAGLSLRWYVTGSGTMLEDFSAEDNVDRLPGTLVEELERIADQLQMYVAERGKKKR